MFHLAGIPSYLVVAELAINQVLRGALPKPAAYPDKLRASAPDRWYGTAHATLAYAKANHASAGRLTETAGAIATASVQAAHGVLAGRGEWVTNEKRLLERAGLRAVDEVLASLATDPDTLTRAVTRTQSIVESARQERTPRCGCRRIAINACCSCDPVRPAVTLGRDPSTCARPVSE
jgi:hypothetical protein